jgi:hypothetical protein
MDIIILNVPSPEAGLDQAPVDRLFRHGNRYRQRGENRVKAPDAEDNFQIQHDIQLNQRLSGLNWWLPPVVTFGICVAAESAGVDRAFSMFAAMLCGTAASVYLAGTLAKTCSRVAENLGYPMNQVGHRQNATYRNQAIAAGMLSGLFSTGCWRSIHQTYDYFQAVRGVSEQPFMNVVTEPMAGFFGLVGYSLIRGAINYRRWSIFARSVTGAINPDDNSNPTPPQHRQDQSFLSRLGSLLQKVPLPGG